MISAEELIKLNKLGFIPGPNEKEKDFLLRVEYSTKLIKDPKLFFEEHKQKPPFEIKEKIMRPRWNWTRAQLLSLFDISPTDLAIYYSDQNLSFLQPAATWILSFGDDNNIKIPLLQFRHVLRKKTYLWIYTLDEILAHEAVHAARVAFDEPKTEEIFAYLTASSHFRRVFGPIVKTNKDIVIFFSFLFLSLLFQAFWVMSSISTFSYISAFFGFLTLSTLCFGLGRLFVVRRKMKKTFKKLKKILNDKKKAKAVLFRLTDFEIFNLYKMKIKDIENYFETRKEKSLRIKAIYLSYFVKS
ncbi:MAG: hypothetical protein JXA94_01880 [Parachlamydiales bacterium]|nr:hypothetical protein [Parachlamydiales bacterium]